MKMRMKTNRINEYIVSDPEICHGKLAFKGTRILVSDVIELVAAGESIEGILESYPGLSKEMIREALEYAAKTIRGEHYVKFSKIPA